MMQLENYKSAKIAEAKKNTFDKAPKNYDLNFKAGDTVNIEFKTFDITGAYRLQSFQGIVIYRSNKGIASSVLIRKMFKTDGVERLFKIYSPMINKIEVIKKIRGRVIRRARIYYLSKLTGKKAKIRDKFTSSSS